MAYTTLISPEELFPHLEDPAWLVVDCQFDLDDPEGGLTAYIKGHIPGAVYADLERDLSAPKTGTNGRHPLASTKELIGLFSQLGIAESMQVVAYDNFGSAFAARLWWTLRYMGHDTVAVLDGGLGAWTSRDLPLSMDAESRPVSTFHASPRCSFAGAIPRKRRDSRSGRRSNSGCSQSILVRQSDLRRAFPNTG
jgi:thiosulfate/3-mercaptopyruvate sulfurtransferase